MSSSRAGRPNRQSRSRLTLCPAASVTARDNGGESDASVSRAASGKKAAPHEAATSWLEGVKSAATRMVVYVRPAVPLSGQRRTATLQAVAAGISSKARVKQRTPQRTAATIRKGGVAGVSPLEGVTENGARICLRRLQSGEGFPHQIKAHLPP